MHDNIKRTTQVQIRDIKQDRKQLLLTAEMKTLRRVVGKSLGKRNERIRQTYK